ncbi:MULTISPECIES: hypothetical protein [Halobacteriales]|uniref:Uncharacterized protein n=2 Tax=Halobacteriales TaxID=2235 RepID=A0A1I0QZG6_9EURY|nr:hypothetical protein [Natrinema salifodinae]SEW33022.1 hypothetical protein SAMN05216285_4189 [Natrinema salifodinae]
MTGDATSDTGDYRCPECGHEHEGHVEWHKTDREDEIALVCESCGFVNYVPAADDVEIPEEKYE